MRSRGGTSYSLIRRESRVWVDHPVVVPHLPRGPRLTPGQASRPTALNKTSQLFLKVSPCRYRSRSRGGRRRSWEAMLVQQRQVSNRLACCRGVEGFACLHADLVVSSTSLLSQLERRNAPVRDAKRSARPSRRRGRRFGSRARRGGRGGGRWSLHSCACSERADDSDAVMVLLSLGR